MMSSVSHFSFTVADQVHQLIEAREADPDLGFVARTMALCSLPRSNPDLGFVARTMALCSLPRSNPGNRKEYKRVNGPFTLYMYSSDESNETIAHPGASIRHRIERKVTIEVLTVDQMLIFLADITYHPL